MDQMNMQWLTGTQLGLASKLNTGVWALDCLIVLLIPALIANWSKIREALAFLAGPLSLLRGWGQAERVIKHTR
jgi:hypothetical protein